jgi:DNA gyrase/topoisomerase IV subunit B
LKVTIEDAEAANLLMSDLMGNDPKKRRAFIEQFGSQAEIIL